MRYRDLRGVLASSVAIMAVAVATPAMAQIRSFDIPAQSAATGIPALAKQADIQLLVSAGAVTGKKIRAIRGQMTVDEAIRRAVGDADLQIINSDGRTYTLAPRVKKGAQSSLQAPVYQATQAPQYDNDIIVVTAQKKEERITDVPISMTALSAKALDDYKIEGGSELLRAIPNVNFSKSNFSMYNFSIRGIGTKAISASSDPAVAINFNNTPLIRNRLFEAEFFDMERVEVLRGPQGTLYGRNATGGVVNMIPAQPTQNFAGEVKGEVGSFKTRRLSGMLNLPLTDNLALRVAGAWTKRDGFDFNEFTNERTNGRDLYSTRAMLRWEPTDRLKLSAVWQHFGEDDDRLRTGKQLCTRDSGPESVGGKLVTNPWLRGRMSQGCLPKSLYDDAAYGAPNAYGYAFLYIGGQLGMGSRPGPGAVHAPNLPSAGNRTPGEKVNTTDGTDPYEHIVQSKDLRRINSGYDPVFRANNDIFQLNVDFEISDGVRVISQTAYATDEYFSTQDYNRFNPLKPMFNDTRGTVNTLNVFYDPVDEIGKYQGATPNGIFCDPQLGCRDRMIGADLMKSDNRQWTQELRVQSDWEGKFNFNIGLNYIDFKTQDDYYVFNNMFTLIAQWNYSRDGLSPGLRPCELGYEGHECPYVDPNPIGKLNNKGHNYFLSQNGVKTKSTGIFGEIYYEMVDNVKLTLGARYTTDDKVSTQIPSELLLAGGPIPGNATGGYTNSGYNPLPPIKQKWNAFSGRAVIDWRPSVDFTDDTLLYFSASRGYKGGGTNPPRVNFNPKVVQYLPLATEFEPEYLTALELGTKNVFQNGKIVLNANAFYYDYKNYQISQITERIAFNENYDAATWGIELESSWRPSRHFKVDGNLGYLRTRIKNGEQSIDTMNRTLGDPDWMVLRPWLQVPSNCIAPRVFVEKIVTSPFFADPNSLSALCPGATRVGTFNHAGLAAAGYNPLPVNLSARYGGFTYDPLRPYNPDTVGMNIADGGSGAPNGGRGFYTPLGGNELPNSPRMTFNFGAEYSAFLDSDRWKATIRGDYYRQSKSYARVYNSEIDRIKGYGYVNLSLYLDSLENDLSFNLYVKNLFDVSPIVDIFINSDDVGLPANVFTLDPRVVGFSVKKRF